MASSSQPQLHSRYRYQMLPSKDAGLRVTESPDGSLATGPDVLHGGDNFTKSSWKNQGKRDLKPSSHRDT